MVDRCSKQWRLQSAPLPGLRHCSAPGKGRRVQMYRSPPSLVFAVLGQARADGKLSPEDESDLLAKLLTYWAMRSTLDMSEVCATLPRQRAGVPVT